MSLTINSGGSLTLNGGSGGGAISAVAAGSTATAETTTSTTYTSLTTETSATLTTGTSALVTIDCNIYAHSGGSGQIGLVSFAVSGATTRAASDTDSMGFIVPTGTTLSGASCSRTFLVTGLTAGSNTFSMKFRVDSGSKTFQSRSITVMAL